MLLLKSVNAPSDFPTLELCTQTSRSCQGTKRKRPSRAWFPPPELAQLLNYEQFPSFLNLGKVSSTTHFFPVVSHVLYLEFNAKLNTMDFNIVTIRLDILGDGFLFCF
jgi:hypothetical protein